MKGMVKGTFREKRVKETEGQPISNCPLVPPAPLKQNALHRAITEVEVEEEVRKGTL